MEEPPLESFVSADPSELLSLFTQKASEEDVVRIRIYSNQDLVALRCRVVDRLAATVGRHSWFDPEAFCDMRIEQGCISTRVEIRDSDDEWLCVAALLDVTTREQDVRVRLVDDDGDFLLIEAAESLPDWLDPDLSAHRAWLYRGVVSVVLDEPGRTIPLDSALEAVPSNRNNRASRAATAAVSRRIRFDMYDSPQLAYGFEPAGKLATIRKVTLPEKLAEALRGRPRLVSVASRYAKKAPAATGRTKAVCLRFSRATYAKLSYEYEDVGGALAAGFREAVSKKVKLDGVDLDEYLEMPVVVDIPEEEQREDEDEFVLDREKLEAEFEALRLPDRVVDNVDDFLYNDDPIEDTVHADGVLHVLSGAGEKKKIVIEEDDDAESSSTAEDDYSSGGEEDELAETEMAKSFCRASSSTKDKMDPLDIDYNLVKSLLDSLQASADDHIPSRRGGPADLFVGEPSFRT